MQNKVSTQEFIDTHYLRFYDKSINKQAEEYVKEERELLNKLFNDIDTAIAQGHNVPDNLYKQLKEVHNRIEILDVMTGNPKKIAIYESGGKYYLKYTHAAEREISKTWYLSLKDEKQKAHDRLNRK